MKRTVLLLAVLLVLLLAACGVPSASPERSEEDDYAPAPSPPAGGSVIEASSVYLTFEETLSSTLTDDETSPPFITDMVIAQYVGHRPFGDHTTEFEFLVLDRVVGNAADRIFVYMDHMFADIRGGGWGAAYRRGALTFSPETEYLLPLIRFRSPYAKTQDEAFFFINNLVVDLHEPANSVMYGEPLSLHSTGFDFNAPVSRYEIISYVSELTRDISPPAWEPEPIRSTAMEEIIHESPYVLLVEVNEPLRLSSEQAFTDFMLTDLYLVTILRVLKGDLNVADSEREFMVIFFADTVLPGEQHIVAVVPIEPGSPWFEFTSRDSLFRMDQLDEIMTILGHQ
ncbi:MAG: hypothetical protein FWC72_02555 [Oscillospiraceae bacterium]|nr:hypothetical protein [Oscillospiraceae bacterium]